MPQLPIYLDNHATTRLDPRVLDAMLPYFSNVFGNPGSTTHSFGREAKEAVDAARERIAEAIGAKAREIVFTSGATESDNLALRGAAEKLQHKGRHLVSVVTEHPAVLDPLKKLAARGFDVTLLPVTQSPSSLLKKGTGSELTDENAAKNCGREVPVPFFQQAASDRAGLITAKQVAAALRDDTILVSVMLANNEIGAIQPLADIGRVCKERGVLLHTDATQAVGRMPVDVEQLQVDLMSFTAHKIYGPKGIGALYVRHRGPQVKLEPIIDGGGQERGLRSGTLNVPGIVGFARALELCLEELPAEAARLRGLRDRLYAGLKAALPDMMLNGPTLDSSELRLPGNLNVSFGFIQGEAILLNTPDLAMSSGSACTSAIPEPSHVLRSLGMSDEAVGGSIRIGLGRFNTAEEVEFAIARLIETVKRLWAMGSVAGHPLRVV